MTSQPHEDLAAAVLEMLPDGPVEVTGEGATAETVRRLLGGRSAGEAPPRAVVETTGTAAGIAAALERVASGGRVVVAAPVADVPAFDTYSELHVRGLELVVVPS